MSIFKKKLHSEIRQLERRVHLSRDMVALYTSRTLMRIALGALGVFLPIFFYKEYNHDLSIIILIFGLLFLIHFLITPLAMRLLSIIGLRRMIVAGIIFAIMWSISLFFVESYGGLAVLGFIVFAALYRVMYWVPFHVDFALFLDKKHRGMQLALLRNISGTLMIISPIIGGFLITRFGFHTVFIFSAILMIAAIVPLHYMRETYERYEWDYIDTIIHLFSRKNRSILFAHAANGAQGVVTTIFWPLYVFILLDERYTALGIITSITLIALTFLRYIVGKLFDRWSENKMILLAVVFSATGWIVKIFVQTPFEIFIADTYHRFGRVANSTVFDAATYEQSADSGRYIDEYTAIKEMSLNVGRIFMVLLIYGLLAYFGMKVSFVLAAIVTLLMILMNKHASIT